MCSLQCGEVQCAVQCGLCNVDCALCTVGRSWVQCGEKLGAVQCAVWGKVGCTVQCGEAVKPCARHLDSLPALTRRKAIDDRHHPGVGNILINQDFLGYQ